MSDLQTILSFPPDNAADLTPKQYDDKLRAYWKSLQKLNQSIWTKTIDKKNILEFLNPAVNTIGYVVSLDAQRKGAEGNKKATSELLDRSIIFFATFDPVQARYMSEPWTRQLDWVFDTIYKTNSTDLTPIAGAILRLDPTAGTFTTTHLRFVRACLEFGVPSQALPILDKNIYAFPTNPQKTVPDELLSEDVELSNGFITPDSKFTRRVMPEHVLEYYLSSASIYIGLRNFSRARLFLEYIILTPSQNHVVSHLQVEAYKKWVIVGLLAEGRMYPLPRTHDAAVMKSLKALGKPYEALADDFEKRDFRKYQAEMDAGAQVWRDDGNTRLVVEGYHALLRYRVLDLQKTYAALPVSRVASHLGFASADDAVRMLSDMIRSRHLSASITPSQSGSAGDAVLRFHFNVQGTSSSDGDGDLEAQTKRIEELVTFVRDADRRLQLTKEYVEVQKRVKRQGPDADLADQMDLSWEAPGGGVVMDEDNDEDIMAL